MRNKILLPACGIILKLIYVPVFCFGQLMTNNGVAITINGGQLTVNGDVLNNAGTTISNSGLLQVAGNWINNSGNDCFGASAGTVYLIGANQTIGGSNSTVFNNLSAMGSGMKTLLLNTTVGGGYASPAGSLTLYSANLDLNGKTLFITNPTIDGIGVVSGSIRSEKPDNSSKVDWNMQNVTGSHTIPFSNANGTAIPFTYNLTSGMHGHVVISTYATNSANLPYPVVPHLVTSVSTLGNGTTTNMVHRFWEVDAENPGAQSALIFTFDGATEAPAGFGTLYAQRWDNASMWEYPSPGQTTLFSNTLLIPNNNKYGTFGLAKGASPLPMTLISFDAKLNSSKQVEVTWVTASEINNDYFTVQRSTDAHTFESIGNVDGAGNSTVTLNYSYLDKYPLSGVSYYRLKQTDFDGTVSYSEIAAVNNADKSAVDVTIFPNPVTDYALISVSSSIKGAGEILFELFDITGNLIMSKKLSELNVLGENIFKFEKSNLLPGTYLYRITQDSGASNQGRLVVE